MALRDRHKKRTAMHGRRLLLKTAECLPDLQFEAACHGVTVRKYVRRLSNTTLWDRIAQRDDPLFP